jgi:hypothetical protein
MNKSPQKYVFARYSILAVILALICLGVACCRKMHESSPRDQDLVEFFHSNKAALTVLAKLLNEDESRLSYLTLKSLPESGLPPERQAEYVRMLKSLNHDVVLRQGVQKTSIILVQGNNRSPFSVSKALMHMPPAYRKGCTIVSSLDDLKVVSAEGVYVVPIEDDWYVAVQR